MYVCMFVYMYVVHTNVCTHVLTYLRTLACVQYRNETIWTQRLVHSCVTVPIPLRHNCKASRCDTDRAVIFKQGTSPWELALHRPGSWTRVQLTGWLMATRRHVPSQQRHGTTWAAWPGRRYSWRHGNTSMTCLSTTATMVGNDELWSCSQHCVSCSSVYLVFVLRTFDRLTSYKACFWYYFNCTNL